MLLRELFDPQSAYQLSWQHGQARFITADGRDIRVSFHEHTLGTADLVEITFNVRVRSLDSNRVTTMGITGGGDAPKIFGTVLQAINDYVSMNDPEYIMFTADEPSRRKLYTHMVRRLAKTYHRVTTQEYQEINNHELPHPDNQFIFLLKRN